MAPSAGMLAALVVLVVVRTVQGQGEPLREGVDTFTAHVHPYRVL